MTTPTSITSEIGKLAPSAVVELFVLDATAQGAEDIIRFHAGTNQLTGDIVWQGNAYNAFPIQVTGFEYSGNGQLPRPKVTVANISGLITVLCRDTDDLLGAKVTRKRTMVKYLDAVNFTGGTNATADATAEFDDDVFYVDRKTTENRDIVEFELAASFDLQGVLLPRRQIVQNVCPWRYRGTECGYAGANKYTIDDLPTASASLDRCGKRLASCELRFGVNQPLPFGGFPAAGLIR